MAIPIANFSYSSSGLSVTFTDSSLNVPVSWAWDFGDPNSGANNTDTAQNPVHNFSLEGNYLITLTVTNADGSGVKTLTIHVGVTSEFLSIEELVAMRLPSSLTLDPIKISGYIKIEQAFLAPLLTPVIEDDSIYDQTNWPPLANALVAELVSYKILLDQVNQLTLALSNTSSSGSSTSTASLKKLVTGPSSAEWYNNADTVTNFLASTFKAGSVFDKSTTVTICSLAKRLNVDHPICQFIRKTPVLFKIVK